LADVGTNPVDADALALSALNVAYGIGDSVGDSMFGGNLQIWNFPRSSVDSVGFVAINTINGVPTAVGRLGALLMRSFIDPCHLSGLKYM
jgi:hypothetical protein